MQITSYTDYSLRALIFMALKNQKVSIREISKAFDISHHHLTKAVHHLIRLGYAQSLRGKTGGVVLSFAPAEINLRDVVQQLESNMDIVECFKNTHTCRIAPACQLKMVFAEAKQAFLQTLEKYTLADLVKNKSILNQYLNH